MLINILLFCKRLFYYISINYKVNLNLTKNSCMSAKKIYIKKQAKNQEVYVLETVKISKSCVQSHIGKSRYDQLSQYFHSIAYGDKQQIFEKLPCQIYPSIIQSKQKNINFSRIKKIYFSSYFKKVKLLPLPNSICHIKFQNLQILNLSKQQVSNIQSLSFLIAPKLRSLQIYCNLIRNVEPLKKSDFKNLSVITFYENCIKEHEQIYRGNFKKLAKYEFDQNQQDPNNFLQDYRFLFKMQQPMIKKIFVQNTLRIKIKDKQFIKKITNFETQFGFPSFPRGLGIGD